MARIGSNRYTSVKLSQAGRLAFIFAKLKHETEHGFCLARTETHGHLPKVGLCQQAGSRSDEASPPKHYNQFNLFFVQICVLLGLQC